MEDARQFLYRLKSVRVSLPKRMKLFLVLDENIYHKKFVSDFLKRTKDEVIGAAIIAKTPKKNDINNYFIRHLYYFNLQEIIKLGIKYLMKSFYSVKPVLKHYNISFFEVEYDINKGIYLEKIKKKNPDVIISSNSLIFKGEILKLPKICCLNRHSALLPSYGGLLPAFQAYRKGEKYTGASVHLMERRIDIGKVISQKKVRIEKKDSIHDIYIKCFKVSSDALLEALEKVRKRDFSRVGRNNPKSYFSWPTKKQWKEFRKAGGRVI